MPAPDNEAVADAMRGFYLRSHRLMDGLMSANGASLARAKMLMTLAREGAMRSTDLATCFGYAPRTVTEAIDALERDGMVRRDPDPADRRAKRISLTAAGEAALAEVEPLRRDFLERVFGSLSDSERATLVALLGTLNAGLDRVAAERG